jgi:hypothetical protein
MSKNYAAKTQSITTNQKAKSKNYIVKPVFNPLLLA